MVTRYVKKMATTCSPMIGYSFVIIMLASTGVGRVVSIDQSTRVVNHFQPPSPHKAKHARFPMNYRIETR